MNPERTWMVVIFRIVRKPGWQAWMATGVAGCNVASDDSVKRGLDKPFMKSANGDRLV
jgi:hypothetical protein